MQPRGRSLRRATPVLDALVQAGALERLLDKRMNGVDAPVAEATNFARSIKRRVSYQIY